MLATTSNSSPHKAVPARSSDRWPASASRSVAKALRGRRLYDIYDIYRKNPCEKIWRYDAKNPY